MQPEGLKTIRDGIESGLKIALGLVAVIVVLVVVAGPESGVVTARMAEAEAGKVAASLPPAAPAGSGPAVPATNAMPVPAPPPEGPADVAGGRNSGRNVTPPSITSPQPAGSAGELTRVAPREPLSPTETPKPETEGEDVRLRLLPRPVAIDTGTFLVGRGKVRLSGVQPVAPSRECGSGGAAWPCGMQARTALRLWLRARSIRCDAPENFGRAEGTIDAECSLGPDDVGEWLVANGWAEAKADGPYTAVETKAREARRGIWGTGRDAPPPDSQ